MSRLLAADSQIWRSCCRSRPQLRLSAASSGDLVSPHPKAIQLLLDQVGPEEAKLLVLCLTTLSASGCLHLFNKLPYVPGNAVSIKFCFKH
ncbi:hypothetical protein RRG08_012480 [Elysia crispata]|uniref:Uncharacterized protein n=1 Tax=Elysia crispata TaxID=231223 RepID=A0AAE1E3A0_9GAST|nr:hypothetical protein RRG08_012480 [Elysia crispata]